MELAFKECQQELAATDNNIPIVMLMVDEDRRGRKANRAGSNILFHAAGFLKKCRDFLPAGAADRYTPIV